MSDRSPRSFVSARMVAERAGVSRSAVSRTFTDGASVSDATRRKVMEAAGGSLAADALGLHPYGQRPTPDWPSPTWGFGVLGDLLSSYRQVTSLPVWITEYGTNAMTGCLARVHPGQRAHTLQCKGSSP